MKAIQIHSVIDNNSMDYYRYLVSNYRDTSSGTNSLEFCGYFLNTPQSVVDSVKNELQLSAAHVVNIDQKNASSYHVDGLHYALKKMNPQCLNIFADTDTVIVYKGWDTKVQKMMEDNSYGIIATTYEDIGQPCAGEGRIQTAKNSPSCTWFALSPNYDFSQLRLDVFLDSPLPIDSEELSSVFNLPIGYSLHRDSGWQIAPYCIERNIPYFTFINGSPLLGVTPTGHDIKVLCPPAHPSDLPLGVKQYNEEYQFPDGTPFLCHQRGSLRHKFRDNPHSIYFYEACEYYLEGK